MRLAAALAALLFAAPAAAQMVSGTSGLPQPVVNGACLIGQNGQPIWGSCSGGNSVVGPGSSTNGFLPQWNGVTGNALSAGLPVGTSGNSTVVETDAAGHIDAAALIAGGAISNALLANSSVTINSHVLSLGASLTLAFSDFSGQLGPSQGGTGINNGSNTLTLGASTTLPAAPASTQCLHMTAAGAITTTGSDCAAPGAPPGGATNSVQYNAGAGAFGGVGPTAGTVLQGNSGAPTLTATPVLGVNGATTGTLGLANGAASGATTTIQPGNVTAAKTITLPVNTGTLIGTGDTGTVSNIMLANSSITLNSHAVSLGGSLNLGFTDFAGQLSPSQGGTGINNGSNTLTLNTSTTLPAAPASTQCLHMAATGVISTTGSDCSSGGGAPGGATNAIQYNAGAGAFGGVGPAAGTVLQGNSGAPTLTATPVLGVNGTTTGTIGLANGAASGATTTIQPGNVTAAKTITLPANTGTLVGTGDTGTVSNAMLANSSTTVAGQACALGGSCSIAVGNLASIAGGTVVGNPAGSSAAPSATATPVLGVAGSVLGTLGLAGNTSGAVTIQPQAAAGTYNFNLPTSAGSAGQPLLSGGGGAAPMTFGTLGVAAGGTGATSFTANAPLIGAGTSPVTVGARSGNTTTFATASGTLTTGDCVSIDASGNFVDAGGPCTTGGGGGTVNSGTAGQLAYYATTGTAVSGNPDLTISGAAVTIGVAGTAAGTVKLAGATSGTLTLAAPAAASGTLTFPAGTTDFTATGGASQVVKQTSAGGAFTVGQLACGDLSNSGTACQAATGTSGHALPYLDGANAWSGTQSFGEVLGTVSQQSGASYTFAATDCGTTVEFTSASAVTATLPNSLPVGCHIAAAQAGAGQITFSAAAGATMHSAHAYSKTFGQYAIVGLSVLENAGGASAVWYLSGDGA